ncbi:MAG: hypothetical protein VXZ96_16830 [Myxococcota bacterium]|nr:hypothetical protein [Myxococcota bacterium]
MFQSANKRYFEYRKGTTEKYQIIWREGEYAPNAEDSQYTVYVERGRLGMKNQDARTKEFQGEGAHYQSEQHMDSQIDKCLRTGYVEVDNLGAPTPAIEGRAVTLKALSKDNSDTPSLSLNEFELFMLLNWLIDNEVFDNNHQPLQLEKWMARSLRKLGYEKPRLEPLSAFYEDYEETLGLVDEDGRFDEYWSRYLQMSERDRLKGTLVEEEKVPAYKFTDEKYWIVNIEEIHIISNATEKKIKVPDAKSNKKKHLLYGIQKAWLDFHLELIKQQEISAIYGYEIRPWEDLKGGTQSEEESSESSDSSSEFSSSEEG